MNFTLGEKEDLRRIRLIWHTRTIDYSQLKFLEGPDLGVASSVFEIDGSLFNLDVAVVKLPVFPWEVVSFQFETRICDGETNGRHATPEDLPACQ